MPADALLSRLAKVQPKGRGKWVACCPAHDDKAPTLSVREADDGRMLLHCFAGCSAREVLQAAGLDFADLYPDRATDHRIAPHRKPYSDAQLLTCIQGEAMIVAVCAGDLAAGKPLADGDRDRLRVAHDRITDACRIGGTP